MSSEHVLNVPFKYDAGTLVAMARNLDQEQIPELIAALDYMCEDWGITERVINHFLSMKELGEKELQSDEYEFKPVKIETDLRYSY